MVDREREGVGEERAMAAGERGDHLADTWRGGGGPRGTANVGPEARFPREGVELGGGGGGGGQRRAIKAGEDVGPDDVGVDGGDRRGAVVIDGGRRRSHTVPYSNYNFFKFSSKFGIGQWTRRD